MKVTTFCSRIKATQLPSVCRANIIKEIVDDGVELYHQDYETIRSQLLGTVVDSLTKFILGKETEEEKEAYRVSLNGARRVGQLVEAQILLQQITGLDDASIIAACKLNCYDAAFRAGIKAFTGTDVTPSADTISNIRVMVNRTVKYLTDVNVVSFGENFPCRMITGGTITSGDCDFIAKQGIVELKVYKNEIGFKDIVQALIYHFLAVGADKYRARGVKSLHSFRFKNVRIFNPRFNISYTFDLKNLTEAEKDHLDDLMLGGF